MPKNIGENSLKIIFGLIEEKINYLKGLIDGKAASKHTHSSGDVSGLSKVATSNKYSDLDGKPTIPTVPSSLPANGGNADTVDNKHASDFAQVGTSNQFNGEQKFVNSQYAPSVTDSASGVGCAFKASRGLFNEALIDKVIMTSSTGKIPFYKYTGTSSGSMSGLTQVSYIDTNGTYQGSATKWNGYQLRTASSGDTGQAGFITFIV